MNKIIDIIDRLGAINREMKDSNEKLENLLRELQGMYPPQGEPDENEATIDSVVGVGDEKNPF